MQNKVMSKNNGLLELVRTNLPTITIVIISWAIGFALLRQKVNALEATVARYPSEDWFELKFQYIDQQFEEIDGRFSDLEVKIN